MKLRTWLLTRTALSSGLIVGVGMGAAIAADVPIFIPAPPPPPAPVAQLPAVSGFNFKLDISAGRIGLPNFPPPEFAWRVQGAVSIPLGNPLGLQIDGAYAMVYGIRALHAAGHLFWRNPAMALFGAYASWDNWNALTRYRVAVEAEVYLNRISLEGMAGYEWGTNPGTWFGTADIAFYPVDNLRLDVGVQRNFFGNAITAGAEFQLFGTGNLGVAAFFDGAFGTGGYQRLLGGIRLYFGQGPTLIDRHRQDDPRVNVDEMGCGAVAADGSVACAVDSSFSSEVVISPSNAG